MARNKVTATAALAIACAALLASAGVTWAPPASGYGPELVVNGSFEQPDIPTGTFAIPSSLPGWMALGFGIEIQDHVAGNPAAGAGAQFAELDLYAGFYQDIATVAGRSYDLSFLYSARPNTQPADNHFRVTAGGAHAELGPLASTGSTNWEPYSFTFTASGPSTRIEFLDLGILSTKGLGTYIDEVSVQEVAPLLHLCVLYDQTKAHKSGSTVPIKFSLCDATGSNVSAPTITVHAMELTRVDTSASSTVEESGASPSDDFRYSADLNVSGGYIFNLSTRGLETGTWTLTLSVDGAQHSTYVVSFDVR